MTSHGKMRSYEEAVPYIGHVIDDAGNPWTVHEFEGSQFGPIESARHVLVGWQCGFEPMFVAVYSCLPGVEIDDVEAEEIAAEYLDEVGWFSSGPIEADYVIRKESNQ